MPGAAELRVLACAEGGRSENAAGDLSQLRPPFPRSGASARRAGAGARLVRDRDAAKVGPREDASASRGSAPDHDLGRACLAAASNWAQLNGGGYLRPVFAA